MNEKAREDAPDRDPSTRAGAAGWGVMIALVIGYVGIYLCRKNLAVAVPMLQEKMGATREQAGRIASIGTVAYAIGKVVTGRVVDRVGGRAGFLLSLGLVALFGALSVFAPGYWTIVVLYSLNRFVGSGGWGAMMKLVPTWFSSARTGTVTAVLCMGYVLGGVAATLLAREIARRGGGVPAVLGLPGFFALPILVFCAFTVRAGPRGALQSGSPPPTGTATLAVSPPGDPSTPSAAESGSLPPGAPSTLQAYRALFRQRRFLVVCALSFSLTLMRDTFAVWNVDFLTTLHTADHSISAAALGSIGFDIAGGAAILLMGFLYDRVSPARRRWLVTGILVLLTLALLALPWTAEHPAYAVPVLAAIGLLVYGPYSLFTGAMAVESGGPRLAATAAGLIDATGYVGAALSGSAFGWLIDAGTYSLGFRVLAAITAVAAVLSTRLR